MDAILVTIVTLTNYVILYFIESGKSSKGVLGKICTRLPAPRLVWIRQIHATRGVGGSTTMVGGDVLLCVCVVYCGIV